MKKFLEYFIIIILFLLGLSYAGYSDLRDQGWEGTPWYEELFNCLTK